MKKKLVVLIFITLSTFSSAFDIDTETTDSAAIMEMFRNRIRSLTQTNPPFDSWQTTIKDDTPPAKEDRNITTKTIAKPFILSLASINPYTNEYEKKTKSSDDEHNIEISIYENGISISNTIIWDPTEDEHKDSPEFLATKTSQDAQLRYFMCASLGDKNRLQNMIIQWSNGTYTDIEAMIKSFFIDGNTITIYPLSHCQTDEEPTNCDFSTDAHLVECYSTNHFAVKPAKLDIAKHSIMFSANLTPLEINATQYNSNLIANGYSFTKDDYLLDTITTKYQPDGTIDNTLYGESNFSFESFTNAQSVDASFEFNDTAKINLQLIDKHWTDIDDDTPDGCNHKWICGDFNTTIIPEHFLIKELILYNQDDQNFTYIANEEAMQAHIQLSIEMQNKENKTVQNFDINSWENPLSITLSLPNNTATHKAQIQNAYLGFHHGKKTIFFDTTTPNKHLSFNYNRKINVSQNPFQVKGDDIYVTFSTLYEEYNLTTQLHPTKSITFLYARSNTPRTRIESNQGDAAIYYEIYCYSDANSTCQKSLLPDTENSLFNDDPRWFTNSKHIPSFGTAGETIQKRGTTVVLKRASDGIVKDFVTLKYNATHFPYKTTMQNKATPWLLYNPYDAHATSNDFEVEFETTSSNWVGKVQPDLTSTYKNDTNFSRINRRIAW